MKHRTMAGSDKREKVNKHLKELKIESCLLEMAAVCVCVCDFGLFVCSGAENGR